MKRVDINKYKCKKCGLIYKDKDTAKKCEDYCKKYKSCNLGITKYAINKKGGKNYNETKFRES